MLGGTHTLLLLLGLGGLLAGSFLRHRVDGDWFAGGGGRGVRSTKRVFMELPG